MRRVNSWLIFINVAVFALQMAEAELPLDQFALWPIGPQAVARFGPDAAFHWWQLVTSGFLHASPTHLGLNMFGLWMFGRDCEATLGARRYAALYGASLLSASLVQLAVVSLMGGAYPTIGASGAIFGVLLAFGVLFPRRIIVLLLPPIPLPAWLFVTLYGLVELVEGVFDTASGVAHFAHLGGMLGAAVLLWAWRAARR